MPVAEYKVFFDNASASQELLSRIESIKVDQAMGMASEAELALPIGLDASGYWTDIGEPHAQPFTRVRVEIKVRDGDFIPLIDGPIVSQRFELSASPNSSRIVLVVQDDTVLLNQTEQVDIFENQSADQIATALFSAFGLQPETESIALVSGALTPYVVQRGTAMQLLKDLAKRHDFVVYVEPSDVPGTSKGIFKKLDLSVGDFPTLMLVGADRNTNQFTAHFDALRPMSAKAEGIDAASLKINRLSSEAVDHDILGDEPSHDMTETATTLLSRVREPHDGLGQATQSAVNQSAWAFSANAEVLADSYSAVLQPHRVVNVSGAGAQLSGAWLINQVVHSIKDDGYRQQCYLRRNARSAGGGAGLLGSVF